MPDFFQTQYQRASTAYHRGYEMSDASERIEMQITSTQRINTQGSSAAEASKARTLAALHKAKADLQRLVDNPPSMRESEILRARRQAKRDVIRAKADVTMAAIELLRAIAPPIAEALQEVVVPIAQRAMDGWPVRSGRSRDLLVLNVQASGTKFSAQIDNDASYVFFIMQGARNTADKKRMKRGQYAWVTLVRKPMRKAPEKLARLIEDKFREL